MPRAFARFVSCSFGALALSLPQVKDVCTAHAKSSAKNGQCSASQDAIGHVFVLVR